MTPPDLQLAKRRHTAAMTATLSAAFADEPLFSWILRDPIDRQRRLTLLFQPIIHSTRRHGVALRTPDDEAVTLWRLPGRIHPGLWELLVAAPALLRAFGDGRQRAQALSRALADHTPRFDYWYLQFAGVAPAHQGKGWGGTAIRAGLSRARAAGMPVFLETAKVSNVALYRHLGFEVIDEWDAPEDGPHVWSMLWR